MEESKTSPQLAIKVAVGLLFAALVAGGGAYLYGNVNKANAPEGGQGNGEVDLGEDPEDNREGDGVKEVDRSDWRTYTNEQYKFTLQYPQTLALRGENPETKLLFGLSSTGQGIALEFWIQELGGRTLEEVFEEKLELEGTSYFDWIRSLGGEVNSENIGGHAWLFIDGSGRPYLQSHFLLLLPQEDAYLVVDLTGSSEEQAQLTRNVLATLRFVE